MASSCVGVDIYGKGGGRESPPPNPTPLVGYVYGGRGRGGCIVT